MSNKFYTINLSQIISKDIGETKKNLDHILTATTNAILLFDEADPLLAKIRKVVGLVPEVIRQ